ncbi:MAG: hypothetical protein ACXWBQ_03235 [Usitatibacter sp.]
MLVARASLQRLKVSRELDALRESLRWPRAVAAVAASAPARSVLFGALLLVLGRGRVAKLVRVAAGAVALVKLVGMFTRPAPQNAAVGEAGAATSDLDAGQKANP